MNNEQVSSLRTSIHGLAAVVAIASANNHVSMYTHQSRQNLMRGKRWLGKVLEARDAENPYSGDYKTVADIAPETDTAVPYPASDSRAELERLQDYRKAAGMLLDQVKEVTGSNRMESIAWTQVYVSLTDARMCLGEAIGALRDAGK